MAKNNNNTPRSVRCSFCGKAQENVRKIKCDNIKRIIHYLPSGIYSREARMVQRVQIINVILHINRMKDKNHISRCRKIISQNSTFIHHKNLTN